MPKVVYTAAQGLVQEAGSGFSVTSDLALTGGLTASGAVSLASTFGLTDIGEKTAGAQVDGAAGSTAITNVITIATVGNANDGLKLPAGVPGDVRIVHNLSANVPNIYTTGTDKINGTEASVTGDDTVVAVTATTIFIFTGATRGWVNVLSS